MAIYLPDYDAIFLHLPKCGGFWVEEALLRCGLSIQLLPHPNDPLRADRHANLVDLAAEKTEHVCMFVRQPLSWYASWWKYTANKPHNWDRWTWHPTYPLQKCQHSDFNEMIARVVRLEPGFLGRLYSHYMPVPPVKHLYVGQVAKMAASLIIMLRAIVGDELTRERELAIRNIPPLHTTSTSLGAPVWIEENERALLAVEHNVVSLCEQAACAKDGVYVQHAVEETQDAGQHDAGPGGSAEGSQQAGNCATARMDGADPQHDVAVGPLTSEGA